MKISDIFGSQNRESERLAGELAKHMAKMPAMQKEFDALDAECIDLALKYRAAADAQSPSAFEIEAALKRKRCDRDSVKVRFATERDRLRREIEGLTGETIRQFHLDCLERVEGLVRLYRFNRDEKYFDISNEKRSVKISHNSAALADAKQKIFAAIQQIRDMRYRPLAEIEKKISEFKKAFEGFEFDSLETVIVSEQTANDMKPHEPDNSPLPTAIRIPGSGETFVLGESQADRLGRKLAKMRQDLA